MRVKEMGADSSCRKLVLVFGDQLSDDLAPFDDFDKDRDRVWMAEAGEEAEYVWSHKQRLTLFLSAMRHFRDNLRANGYKLSYSALARDPAMDRGRSLREVLCRDIQELRPESLVCTRPGDYRVLQMVKAAARERDIALAVMPDPHFISPPGEFAKWAKGRKRFLLEHFYRRNRAREGILLNKEGLPEGGRWDFDRDNRKSFGSKGPGPVPPPKGFPPDAVTREVMDLVEHRFPGHPGDVQGFDLPVDQEQASVLLKDFTARRLAGFGPYEDAMWSGRPFLFHSRLSSSLNLHLIRPRDCVNAVSVAYYRGDTPVNSAEGFVRQVLGWREFVHGIYWHFMPDYAAKNALDCGDVDVPECFWDGRTGMNCVAQSMQMLLSHGYTHHIHRLMVFGNLALIAGVHPHAFHRWHMAMYSDAVDWVSLPNTLGMSQFGDGGIMATKPYCASGNYIHRMSDFCRSCRYQYKKGWGDDACPVTTLYWDFLERHKQRLKNNPRMALQYKNLAGKSRSDVRALRKRAEQIWKRIFVEHNI